MINQKMVRGGVSSIDCSSKHRPDCLPFGVSAVKESRLTGTSTDSSSWFQSMMGFFCGL